MPGSLFEFTFGQEEEKKEGKVQGIALAEVINNVDALGEGRVQIRLPWLPGIEPWARVACTSAGLGYGHFFQPQVGNEVVVSFNQGNIAEPIILGALWSKTDRPPSPLPVDAADKMIIRTPLGHTIEFDEREFSITITTTTQQKIAMTLNEIEITAGLDAAKLTLGTFGEVSITAATEIALEAPTVSIKAGTIDLKTSGSANLASSGICTITGSTVKIN